jgi:hypothetical protein
MKGGTMFNRELSLTLSKPTQAQEPVIHAVEDTTFGDKVVTLNIAAESMIKKAGIVVCAYVVLDTVRKVLVAQASK